MTIRMKALDSFYDDDVKHVHGKTEFDVESETKAAYFEEKGYAERVTTKAAPKPDNKMKPAASNKARG